MTFQLEKSVLPLWATFYSYKGGTGCSLTLLNTAVELVRRGHPVVILDMDTGAPGMQYFPFFKKGMFPTREGFVDIAMEFLNTNCTTVNPQMISDCILSHPQYPNLHLLPTGKLEEIKDYTQKISLLNWNELLGKNYRNALRLFDIIGDAISCYKPDFILIDAPGGFTDIGGLCCFRLPDMVFLVTSFSSSKLEGTRNIYDSLKNTTWLDQLRDGKPLKTHLVASMIPSERPDLRKERKSRMLKQDGSEWSFLVEIPFNAEMAFNDTIWSVEYPDHPFCQYYKTLAEILESERNDFSSLPLE